MIRLREIKNKMQYRKSKTYKLSASFILNKYVSFLKNCHLLLPLNDKILLYYNLKMNIEFHINSLIQNYKLKQEFEFSFSNFILEQLCNYKSDSIKICDLGSGKTILPDLILKTFPNIAQYVCVDTILSNSNNGKLQYVNSMIQDFIDIHRTYNFDVIILGATLSLLNKNDRDTVIKWCSDIGANIFVREVPRITCLVDHYAEMQKIPRQYDNFTQSELHSLLEKYRYAIVKFEREYDIYIHATINNDLLLNT